MEQVECRESGASDARVPIVERGSGRAPAVASTSRNVPRRFQKGALPSAVAVGAALLTFAAACSGSASKPNDNRTQLETPRVHLVRASVRIRSTCSQVEQALKMRQRPLEVACPEYVPPGRVINPVFGSIPLYPPSSYRDGYVMSFISGRLHWIVEAGTRTAEKSFIDPPNEKQQTRDGQVRTINGYRISVFFVPCGGGAMYSCHVVAAWTQAGVAYNVSVHGHAHLGIALAMASDLIKQIGTRSTK